MQNISVELYPAFAYSHSTFAYGKGAKFGVEYPLKDRTFTPMGDAVAKIQGRPIKSREVYFAIYQAIADRAAMGASGQDKPGLFRKYPPDFFDLIIVDG